MATNIERTPCLCGCGDIPKGKTSKFMPGHDARFYAGRTKDERARTELRRTTIMAPDDVLDRLQRGAAERGVSLAALIREALEEKAKTLRPKPRSLGLGDSGHTDTSRRTGEERPVPRSWR